MSTTTTITLPATRREIPAEPLFRVTGCKTQMGREGQAVDATLRLGTKIVGHLINEGYGGDTRLLPTNREASIAFDAWALEFKALQPDFAHFDDTMAHELAADSLIEEFQTAKVLAKTDRVIVADVPAEGPISLGAYSEITGGGPDGGFLAWAAKQPELKGKSYWDPATSTWVAL